MHEKETLSVFQGEIQEPTPIILYVIGSDWSFVISTVCTTIPTKVSLSNQCGASVFTWNKKKNMITTSFFKKEKINKNILLVEFMKKHVFTKYPTFWYFKTYIKNRKKKINKQKKNKVGEKLMAVSPRGGFVRVVAGNIQCAPHTAGAIHQFDSATSLSLAIHTKPQSSGRPAPIRAHTMYYSRARERELDTPAGRERRARGPLMDARPLKGASAAVRQKLRRRARGWTYDPKGKSKTYNARVQKLFSPACIIDVCSTVLITIRCGKRETISLKITWN